MNKSLLTKISILIVVFFLMVGLYIFSRGTYSLGDKSGVIHFISTGNSDAFLIESNGHYGLIDSSNPDNSGSNNDGLAGELEGDASLIWKRTVGHVVSYLNSVGVKKLDFILATHSHYDHIGGMSEIAKKYVDSNTKYYYRTYVKTLDDINYPTWYNLQYYNKSISAMKQANAQMVEITNKTPEFTLGDFTIKFLNTEAWGSDDPAYEPNGSNSLAYCENANSIGTLITIGKNKVFLGADIELYDEKKIMNEVGKIDVLKPGHHMYNESSSYDFLNVTKPDYVIVSNDRTERFDNYNAHMNYGAMAYMIANYGTTFYATTGDYITFDAIKLTMDGNDYSFDTATINKTSSQNISAANINNVPPLKANNTWYRISKDNKWVYLKNGSLTRNNWVQDDSAWYYIGDDGTTVTGEYILFSQKYNNSFEYVFDSTCKMVTGWQLNGDGINWNYYATTAKDNYPEGSKVYSDWVYSDGYWYYINELGNMIKGIFNDGQNTFYFNPEKNDSYPGGAMITKWLKLEDSYYYFNPNSTDTLPVGAMIKDDWVKDNNKWYYMGNDGKMLTGRHLLDDGNGNIYYYTFGDDGALLLKEDATDFSITYDLGGGSANGNPDTYTINSDDITLINPTRVGYTFAGWTGSNGNIKQLTVVIKKGSTGNKNYIANWTPNNDTKYVVNHYVYDNNNNYKLYLSESLSGPTDKKLVLADLSKNIDNYIYSAGYLTGDTIKPTTGSIKSTTIKADGTTVINLYYTIDSISINLYSVTKSNTIYRVPISVSVNDFKNNIVITNGTIQIVDKEGNFVDGNDIIKTGYQLKASFNDNVDNQIVYQISVIGDVLGEGNVSLNGARKVAKYIFTNKGLEEEYLLAADYNGDGVVKMNDAMLMLR